MERHAERLAAGMVDAASEAGVVVVTSRVGTMFTLFVAGSPHRDWATARACDTTRYGASFRAMLEAGVYLASLQFETGFMLPAHGEDVIEATLSAARKAFS